MELGPGEPVAGPWRVEPLEMFAQVAGAREWHEWEAEEMPFLLDDRPWERADFIVGTASTLPHDARAEVMVASPLDRR